MFNMKILKTGEYSVTVPLSIIKQGTCFVAYSFALDLSTVGTTKRQAIKHFREAVDLFIEECSKKGTLDTVFQQLGWKKVRHAWNPPRIISHESIQIHPVLAING